MTATLGSSAIAATEARPRPVAAGRLNGDTTRLIPHHQDDKYGPREYRSPERVVRTRRPGGSGNDRPRWEVHERQEGRAAGWRRRHAAFERRRDALVFLDTTAAEPGNESVTTAPPGDARPPNPRRNPSPACARHGRGRSPTTSTKPAPRTSRGRCAACSCTIRGRSRRPASRRPAGSASGSGRRPATGNARQRRRRPDRMPAGCARLLPGGGNRSPDRNGGGNQAPGPPPVPRNGSSV